jgi:hypothetical protein
MEFRQQTNQLTLDLQIYIKLKGEGITGSWDIVDQLDILKQIGALLSDDVNEEFKDTRAVWIYDY